LGTTVLQVVHQQFKAEFFTWVLSAFFVYLVAFSAFMLGWVIYQIIRRRWRRGSWLFFVIALHFAGLAITSMQYMGYRVADPVVALLPVWLGERTITLFLHTFVISAFFLELVIVFYVSVRRYLRLYDKEQRALVKLARAKEEGLTQLLLGVENERRRIARELHDGACVNLAAIRMKLDTLRDRAAAPQLAAELAAISVELEYTYRELRGISHDLMSQALENTDLLTALEDLVARVQRAQPDLQVALYANYDFEKINRLAKIHLYRIVQELLGNVLKHAGAHNVTLQLLEHEGRLMLTLEDDGRGFDPASLSGDGIGLANVRARVGVLHGTLHLESKPGKGTFVSIEVTVE
jgi:two-component system NarL family sensor kinase